jgi:TPR repeat protein
LGKGFGGPHLQVWLQEGDAFFISQKNIKSISYLTFYCKRLFMEVIYLLLIVCLVVFAVFLKPLIDEEIEAAKMIKNYRELFLQTKHSAENGNIKDMYLLSSFYQKGIGIKQNIEKSFYCYKAAKEKECIELNEELEKNYALLIPKRSSITK